MGDADGEEGVALALSGGGYRAMLFHTGAMWRLDELGVLRSLARISSVSGGSIAAGVLASRWDALQSGSFRDVIVEPIRALARTTIDLWAIALGLLPFVSAASVAARCYRKRLFGGVTLQDLPDTPRFVFNATNVESGKLVRISKAYLADYTIGVFPEPELPLAIAVAASAAFPPVLSPLRLAIDPAKVDPATVPPNAGTPPTRLFLTDGGVYDNLGVQTVERFSPLLVSDGGAPFKRLTRVARNWVQHGMRCAFIADSQVRALRNRMLLERERVAVWGIDGDITAYQQPDVLAAPADRVAELAHVETTLRPIPDAMQERLINWGYAICDAAYRRFIAPGPAPQFPYSRGI